MTERNTKQKQTVYDALVALGHPSATEVYEYLCASGADIGRGTVFRVLSSFARVGRAVRLHVAGSDDLYDATLTPHFHARCRVCGAVRDVFAPELAKALSGVKTENFITERTEISFYGVCEKCRNR